jgi:hypothetical protein
MSRSLKVFAGVFLEPLRPSTASRLAGCYSLIGTGREGLAFIVLSLRSTPRRCPLFVLILALMVYAERRAELNERWAI